jgi:dTDP-4-amino-4,6-dideoxygalactose transaminase
MNQHARLDSQPIPFIDVMAQRRRLGTVIDDAVTRVLNHCQFILGPEVRELETQLAAFCGARYAISCASGTDALTLVLLAKGIGPGDAVFCPSFTFAATAEVVALVGATPVFVDIEEATFNIDSASLERAISTAKNLGLKPKAVLPVDLFGLPADHDSVAEVAEDADLFVLDDAAQGFGATYKGKKLGTFGLAAATSFFPAKPLGCYGDGGAVFTNDDALAETIRGLRVHGQMPGKPEFSHIGLTGRLDTIQAAILIEKLKIFPEEIEARNRAARHYSEKLGNVAIVPSVPQGYTSVWAQYTIRLAPGLRDGLAAALKAEGIPTAIYYAKPPHRHEAYKRFPVADGGLPITEKLADEVISLPMHAYLDEATQDRIIEAVKRTLSR